MAECDKSTRGFPLFTKNELVSTPTKKVFFCLLWDHKDVFCQVWERTCVLFLISSAFYLRAFIASHCHLPESQSLKIGFTAFSRLIDLSDLVSPHFMLSKRFYLIIFFDFTGLAVIRLKKNWTQLFKKRKKKG